MNRNETGIVILGHPRSGTTLLRRLLDGHSRIACPPETHVLGASARFLHSERTAAGVDMGVLSGLNFAGFPDETTLEELRRFAFSFLERYAAEQKKPRWAEKTAFDAFHTEKIVELCGGRALFVCVVRHPLDVAVSTREFCDSLGIYPEVLHRFIQRYPSPIEAFSHSWLEVAGQFGKLAAARPGDTIIVRYEDLVASPAATLGELLAFLEEDFEPGMLDAALGDAGKLGFGDHKSYTSAQVHGDSLDRWQSLPDYQVASLAPVLNPALAAFNYPLLPTAADMDPAASRARYINNLEILARRPRSTRDNVKRVPRIAPKVERGPCTLYDLGNRPRGNTVFSLQQPLDDALCEQAQRLEPSMFVQVAAAAMALQRRVGDQEVLMVDACAEANPQGGKPGSIPLRIPNDDGMAFSDILGAVGSALSAPRGDNSSCPVDMLVCQSPLRPDCAGDEHAALRIDLEESGNGATLAFSFDRGLWSDQQAARCIEHFLALLSAQLEDPRQQIDRVQILSREESRILFPAGRGSQGRLPRVDEQFFAQVQRQPDKVALVFGDEQLTYGALGERVRALAGFITARGVGCGARVAVCLHRSTDLVTALLAVMHAGATYIPLDPDHPTARINQILEDADPEHILTERVVDKKFTWPAGKAVTRLDASNWQRGGATPDSAGAELAYIIFTSGSTGRPKGVEITHHGLSAFLAAMSRRPGLDADDRLLSVTTVSFDIAALELFLPLTQGATLYLSSRQQTLDGRALNNLLTDAGITVFQATPATYQLLLHAGWAGNAGLRLLCGGEALPAELAAQLLERGRELWNMYGPTETTIWSTVKQVTTAQSPMPIGTPIDGTRAYVLNGQQVPAPIGAAGELYIAGDGVARGYLGRPDLTAERFVADPFAEDAGATMYRTGDLARVAEDGDLYYLGRIDRQVKIRGFRVELGEIELAIAALHSVRQCVVEVHHPPSGSSALVAYVVPRSPGEAVGIREIQDHLQEKLPQYMIPAAAVNLDALPLTPNNKVDRKALPAPQPQDYTSGTVRDEAPRRASGTAPSALEEQIIARWKRRMRVGDITPDATFVSLGGDSLTYVETTIDLEDLLGLVPDDWERMSIRELAAQQPRRGVTAQDRPGNLAARLANLVVDIDTTIFIRAIAIVAIVLLHIHPSFGGLNGWTSGLFMVSGYLLAKFQYPMVIADGNPRVLALSTLRILLPCTLYMVAIQLLFYDFRPDVLLLYSNLSEFSQPPPFFLATYWFNQVMVQCLLFMALLFCIPAARRFAASRPFLFGIALLGFAAAIMVASRLAGHSEVTNYYRPEFRFCQFALGWLILFCDNKLRRMAAFSALCFFTGLEYVLWSKAQGPDYAVITLTMGIVLLFFPRISVLRPLHRIAYALAGASLFIFLVHMQVLHLMMTYGYGKQRMLVALVALLAGYVMWRAWDAVWLRLGLERREPGLEEAA